MNRSLKHSRWARALVAGVAVGLLVLFLYPSALQGSNPLAAGHPLSERHGHSPLVAASASTRFAPRVGVHPSTSVIGPFQGKYFQTTTIQPHGLVADGTGVAVDPATGIVYELNGNSDLLSVFYEGNGTLIRQVLAGDSLSTVFPSGIALDTANHTAYIAFYSYTGIGGYVLAVNTVTFAVTANITTAGVLGPPFDPSFLAFDPGTQRLYVENSTDGKIMVVSTVTNRITQYVNCPVIGCGGFWQLIDIPQLGLIAQTTGTNGVVLYYTSNNTVDKVLGTGLPISATAAAYIPPTGTLVVANSSFSGAPTSFFQFNLTTFAYLGKFAGGPPYVSWMGYGARDNVLVLTNFTFGAGGNTVVETFDGTTDALLSQYVAPGTYAGGLGPFAIDTATDLAVLAGFWNAPSTALRLPGLSVAHTYSSYASIQSAAVVDRPLKEVLVLDVYPDQLQALSETSGAVLWTSPLNGLDPLGVPSMAVDDSAGLIYIADAATPQLFVVLADTGHASSSIPLPIGVLATALAVDSVNHLLYVSETSGEVAIFSSQTGSLIGTIPVPGFVGCAGVADSRAKAAYFVNCRAAGNVTPVESVPMTRGPIYVVGAVPAGVALDAQGNLYVLNSGSGNITTIQVPSGARGSFSLGGFPGGSMGLDASDHLLLVGTTNLPSAEFLNSSTGAVIAGVTVGNASQMVAYDDLSGTFVLPSPYSGSTFLLTRLSTPAAPTALIASPGNNSLALHWTPVTSAGLQVTYNVTLATAVAGPYANLQTVGTPYANYTNLVDGTVYYAKVTAANPIGTGAAAGPVNATPAGVPYPPASVSARPAGSGSILVTWTPPVSIDGAPIVNYTVLYSVVGSSQWTRVSAGASLAQTLTGLSAATFYQVYVVAWNALGASHPSATTTGVSSASASPLPGGLASEPLLFYGGIGVIAAFGILAGVFIATRKRSQGRASAPPPQNRAPPTGPT